MRWKCLCSYDGTDFNGWQSQPSGNTIQDILEDRLGFIFGRSIRIHGSSRTDSGVHANAQVFHFDAKWQHGSQTLLAAIKCGIPKTISVFSAEETTENFHARFSAIRKKYKYFLLEGNPSPFEYRYVWSLGKRRLDLCAMNSVAAAFLGLHNFTAFGAKTNDYGDENYNKRMFEMYFHREGNKVIFSTTGSGYLYKMVRIMVGCFVQVGLGNISGQRLIHALNGDSVEQYTFRKECAPPTGLFLDQVFY